jgi:hypothetical protein
MSLNKRLVDLVRKSDNKKLYAEVRISPSRFSDDMSDETLTVSFHDFTEGMTTTVLQYDEYWNWENDDYKCHYIIPEPRVEVQLQAPRSVSPIATKMHHMTVATTK